MFCDKNTTIHLIFSMRYPQYLKVVPRNCLKVKTSGKGAKQWKNMVIGNKLDIGCWATRRDREVVKITRSHVKTKSRLTNFKNNSRIEGYKGQIQKELRKFLMIFLNLIKSDNESVIEIRENDIL